MGRIYIEKIDWPFLSELKGTPAEYQAGLDQAIANGWLILHENGIYVRFTETVRRCSLEAAGQQFSRIPRNSARYDRYLRRQ